MNLYLDGVMGLVVGDAFGSPAQFRSREELKDNPVLDMIPCECFHMPAGSWTDDSSLALANFTSIIENAGYNLTDIADRYVRWLEDGEFTPFGQAYDIGYGCESGICRYQDGKMEPQLCGANGERDNGNGSLMRCLPLNLYFAIEAAKGNTTDDEAIKAIHDMSAITHRHIRAQMGCGIYYFMIKHIIADKDSKSLQGCLQEGIDEAWKYYGKNIALLTELAHYGRIRSLEEFKTVQKENINTSGYVVHTLEAAVWNLITTDNYMDCLIQTVNLGDDADTVGAVAGGLAGLYYGYDDIPEDWLSKIQRREWIEELCKSACLCKE